VKLYDAHNHLQDGRLKAHLPAVMEAVRAEPIARMVVNGSCEEDWPEVLELARAYPQVLPSFGYHPWHIKERTTQWRTQLARFLEAAPSAVGEIGLDRWIKDHHLVMQEEVFVWQLRLASERGLPVSIHCIQAWGPLMQILRREPRPPCGFLLHSYGGSAELVGPLAELGAYFSLPGYFAHERKVRQRETFRRVPLERLLIETDAPDQLLPAGRNRYSLLDDQGRPLNHPGNVRAVYEFAAEWLGLPLERLAGQVEANFLRLFALK
jgi:TatD DNase family protein